MNIILRLLFVSYMGALCPSCGSFFPEEPATTKTTSLEGVTTVTESLDAMKERLFQERCAKTLEGGGL